MGSSESNTKISNEFKDELFKLQNLIIENITKYKQANLQNINQFQYVLDDIGKAADYIFIKEINEKDIITESKERNKINSVLKGKIEELYSIIKNKINNSYNNKKDFYKVINKLKNDIQSIFQSEIKNIEVFLYYQFIEFSKEYEGNKIIQSKNPIQNESRLKKEKLFFNVITSKDIQEKLLEITRDFQNISMNNISDDDIIENKTIAEFFKNIANISIQSFNDSHEFLNLLYKEFNKDDSNNDKVISSIDFFEKKFSSWVKNNNNAASYLDKYLKDKNLYVSNYFDKLYKNLLILYYQCQLSFPSIEINFKREEIFDSNKMIDFINKGNKNKKVNFVIFPSFFSNGNFLENGKQWVFTYFNNERKKTFFFETLELTHIIEDEKKFKIPNIKDKLELKIYIEPKLNYEILEGTKQEFTFYLKNKQNQKIEKIKANSKIELKENQEFINCEFNFMDEINLSYRDLKKLDQSSK